MVLLISGANSQTISPAEASAKQVRDLYFERDFDGGAETGKKLIAQFPAAAELRMWAILNTARATGKAKEAVEMAKVWAAQKDGNPRAQIALAIANSYAGNHANALKAAEAAIKLTPDDEETILTYNMVLFRSGKYAESIVWLDKNSASIKDRSRFYNARGLSNYRVGNKEKAFQEFDASVKIVPTTVNAIYLYADYLNLEKRTKEALPLLKRALQMAPGVLANRVAYWETLDDQTDKTDEQKRQEVIDDMNAILRSQPNTPELLYNVALRYGVMKFGEKQKFYEDQLLKQFPNSRSAEHLIVKRINELNKTAGDLVPSADFVRRMSEVEEGKLLGNRELLDEALRFMNPDKKLLEQIGEAWMNFIKRPQHFESYLLGTAYSSLFNRAQYDYELTDQRLKELLEGVKKHKAERHSNTNSDIASFLAFRKIMGLNTAMTGDILSYAKAGIDEAEADIADYRQFLSGKELEKQAKYQRASALETVGYALYLENRLDEAEKELVKAFETDKESLYILQTLALVHRARKEYDKAEEIYLKSATVSRPFTTSFKELYKAKHGDLSGFDEYYKGAKEKIRSRIMTEVAASRIKEPKDLAPFQLKTISDAALSSNDLKGKVLVINFWGVWCGPCVKEMPEVQELATRYKNDGDVAILTFDSGDELAVVRKFIADRKYDFPVLIADSYIDNLQKVTDTLAYPTTFFVDKQGKISFTKIGNSGNLVEEFSLRIDILKKDQ